MAARGRIGLILFVCILLALGGASVFVVPQWLGRPPLLEMAAPPTHLGLATPVAVTVRNQGQGLKRVWVELRQGATTELLHQQESPGDGPAELTVELTVKCKELGLAQGPAELVIQAQDTSWGNWFQGKVASLRLPVTVDTVPPRLNLLNRVTHLNCGGAGLVVYEVGEDANRHGVRVGSREFLGHSWPGKPGYGVCFFAYGQDEEKGLPLHVFASDPAANSRQVPLNARLRWKNFREDKINLSNELASALAAKFEGQVPSQDGDSLKAFLYINTTLRAQNEEAIRIAARNTAPQILWSGAFIRPRGKPMASFADRRTYFYQGKEVSKAVHLGVDLADLAQSPSWWWPPAGWSTPDRWASTATW